MKDFGGSFCVVGGGIVIILLPKQFLGSCLALSDEGDTYGHSVKKGGLGIHNPVDAHPIWGVNGGL